jgi:hypothetical protein
MSASAIAALPRDKSLFLRGIHSKHTVNESNRCETILGDYTAIEHGSGLARTLNSSPSAARPQVAVLAVKLTYSQPSDG